jgi:hypothetical protein
MTPLRSIRVDSDLWQLVQAKAKEEGSVAALQMEKTMPC